MQIDLSSAPPVRPHGHGAAAAIPSTPPSPPSPPAARDAGDPDEAAPAATPDQLRRAVEHISQSLKALSRDAVEFSIDGDRTVIKVVDRSTGEVIRQLPNAEALEFAKALDQARGLLIRQTA